MAKLLTPEDCARRILDIFVSDFRTKPGNGLLFGNIESKLADHELDWQDRNAGLQFALEQGWLERERDGGPYMLTEKGFKEA
jgi:hypothetical protein